MSGETNEEYEERIFHVRRNLPFPGGDPYVSLDLAKATVEREQHKAKQRKEAEANENREAKAENKPATKAENKAKSPDSAAKPQATKNDARK